METALPVNVGLYLDPASAPLQAFVFWVCLSAASSSASRSAAANDRSCWGSCEDNTFWLTPLIKTGPRVSDWGWQYVEGTLLPNVEPVHQIFPSSKCNFNRLLVFLPAPPTVFPSHLHLATVNKRNTSTGYQTRCVWRCWFWDFHVELKCYACTQTGIWLSYEQHAFVAVLSVCQHKLLCSSAKPNLLYWPSCNSQIAC